MERHPPNRTMYFLLRVGMPFFHVDYDAHVHVHAHVYVHVHVNVQVSCGCDGLSCDYGCGCD